MFTGIIEAKSKVTSTTSEENGVCVVVEKPKGWKLIKGQSIAIDGICSTVIGSTATTLAVQFMPETLSKTTARNFQKGSVLNLERSLRLNQFVDGHLTQGHVDARVTVLNVERSGMKHLITVAIPSALKSYVAEHGSITLNGVSLTVARTGRATATVALIPYTLEHTNFAQVKKGDTVNLEVDLIARYVIHNRRVLK